MNSEREEATTALIIDCRDRRVMTFMASVTRIKGSTDHIVVRYALETGALSWMVESASASSHDGGRHFRLDMPVIVMGQYQARSSEGHAKAISAAPLNGDWAQLGRRSVAIVGGMGPAFDRGKGKGLRVFSRPIPAILIDGPVVIEEVKGSGNSNRASATAALAGVNLLAALDVKSVFVVEGQSDSEYVVQICSYRPSEGQPTAFPEEHQEEMFSPENILRKNISSSARRCFDRPPEEAEFSAAEKYQVGAYLCLENGSWGRVFGGELGRFFWPALIELAKKMGVEEELLPHPDPRREGVRIRNRRSPAPAEE